MNYQKPPEFLIISGKEYPVNTDFRIWMNLQSECLNKSDDECTKSIINFTQELGLPLNIESVNAVLEFYSGGKPDKSKSEAEKNHKKEKSPRIFDFQHDEELFVSAFRSQYNIDLRTVRLHWWDFLALFKGLSKDETISEIMGYRGMDLSKCDKYSKSRYRKLKEKYSLDIKHYDSLDERNNAMKDKIKQLQKRVNGIG